jgi:chromosome partitioning protein
MAVIILASSKGGAGKTTVAILLASELAEQGQTKGMKVSLIDVDPNQHSAKWAYKDGCPNNIHIMPNIDENTILDAIDEAEINSSFVIVDLEGTASIAVANSVSRADLVIIPCQGSQDDADEAVKTIKLVKRQSRLIKRNIPVSVLMTRTHAALMPRTLKHITQQFSEANVDMFKSTIIEREAFKAIRSFGGSIKDLNPKEVSGIDKAIDNINAFTQEVLSKLTQAHTMIGYKEVV